MITLKKIGTIYTPFTTVENMPIQAAGGKGIRGKIILNEDLSPGVKDLNGFSHIILLYIFHKSTGFELETIPFLDTEKRGIFSTRAPRRPNPIGISVVRLVGIHHHRIDIENVDILTETPLLDIKPYIPDFDVHTPEKIGWIANRTGQIKAIKSDQRFQST